LGGFGCLDELGSISILAGLPDSGGWMVLVLVLGADWDHSLCLAWPGLALVFRFSV
jgi:hypothetical protein